MRSLFILSVIALVVALACPAQAQVMPTIPPGHNGMDTSFARISMPPRPAYEGPSTPLEARIWVKNDSQTQDAFVVLFGFNSLSRSVQVRLESLTTETGEHVPIHQDERGLSSQQPKLWVRADNVSGDQELVLRGSITSYGNGQFHVGALVIAFDEEYRKHVTPQNEYAEVYAFSMLRSVGADAAGRPFEGQGNVPGPATALSLLVLVWVAWVRRGG